MHFKDFSHPVPRGWVITKTFWRIMKLTGVLLLIALLHVSAAGISQKVTLSVKDAPLEKVFDQIKQQTGLSFLWDEKVLNNAAPVTLNVKDATVSDVLNECLKNQGLSYTIVENMVVVRKTVSGNLVKVINEIQEKDVHGRITDSAGNAMAGLTVMVKNSKRGTSTDVSGYFELKNIPDPATLVITGVNIDRLEVSTGGRADLVIVVKTKVSSQEQVVVNAGYYQVSKEVSTGDISRVDAKTIADQPVSNVLQAIQGRMTGVYVQQTTGVAGGGFNIQIQGRNSLRDNGNDALYIVDGVPFTANSLTSNLGSSIIQTGNPLSSINPADIESIDILKDADATAIYGSRGSNGVVLITTKRGKAGKTKTDFSLRVGAGKVAHKMDMLNTRQYVAMRDETFANDQLPLDNSYAYDLLSWDTTRYTDWQKSLIGGTAHTTDAEIMVSGGNANTQFSFGGGYYRETTVFPGDNRFQRASGSLTLNHMSTNRKFRANISINYSSVNSDMLSQDLTFTALTLSPNAPALYDSVVKINADWKNYFIQNPMFSLQRKYLGNTENLIGHALLSYEVLPGLFAKLGMGYTTMQVNEISTSPLSAIPPQFIQGQTGSSAFGNNQIKTWILEPQLDYSNKLGKGVYSLILGGTYMGTDQNGQTISAYGYTNDALLENIQAATSYHISGSTNSEYRYAAVFARINYNWDNRYILNLTGRRDGSSRFGPGNQFGNFGAAGLAWIFSNEQFAKSGLPFLNFGKLRVSYGITGSDAIGNYQYLNSYSPTSYPYNNTSGLVVTRLSNPDYSWESNNKFEAGIDLGFFKDRVYTTINWYNNRSSDQLVGLPLPVLSGESSVQYNFPATVQNTGWEFQINSTNISHPDFKWTTGFNITFPQNKLVKFPNIEAFPAYDNMYKVGESIFIKKTLQSQGVDPKTGLYTFTDVNGDGNISTDDDGFFLKKVSQQFFGGFNNSFTYKGFQLEIFFQFVKQTGYSYINSFTQPGDLSNQPSVVQARWRQPGDITNIQKYTLLDYNPYVNQIFSDAAIVDASFLRLKNVALYWNLPKKWMRGAGFESSKIFIQGQNLFTITSYIGMDPENQNAQYLPPLRMLAAGIQLTL